MFSSNSVLDGLSNSLSQELGIPITEDSGIYLGAPMIHKKLSEHYFSFVLDQMQTKLSGWKAKSLSFVGRPISLAQSSHASLPGYVIQSTAIPIFVCLEAEKLCRGFTWVQ